MKPAELTKIVLTSKHIIENKIEETKAQEIRGKIVDQTIERIQGT